MANSKTVWKGTKDLKDSPESPSYEENSNGAVWTIVKQGPFGACLASKPIRGQELSGFTGVAVDTVRIQKAHGGTGTLTVTLTTAPIEDRTPVLEIEWIETQKKLESHKFFKTLTPAHWDKIEDWRNATTAADRSTKYAALTGLLQKFADKILKGEDSYVVYSPVARVTTSSPTKPNTGGCGMKDNPPAQIKIQTYKYLKTADRAVRQSMKWQRVEEWTGAEEIDDDLYN